MEWSRWLFAANWLCLMHGHAWVLDASCQSSSYRSFVMDAMNGAFDIAEAGQKGFTAIAPQRAPVPAAQQIQPGTLSQGQTDAFNDAFSWLFDTVSSQNIDNIPQQDQQAIQDAQNEWNRLYEVLPNVLNFRGGGMTQRPANQYGNLGVTDLVVYCDFSRFQTDPNTGAVTDPDRDVNDERTFTPDADWNTFVRDCRDGIPDPNSGSLTEAATLPSRVGPQQFQLCREGLNAYTGVMARFRSIRAMRPANWIAKRLNLQVRAGTRTRMDSIVTADGLFLHELTHTYPADTDDSFGGDSYGWRNCVRLSQNPDSVRNAETYMFWSISCALILDNRGILSGPPVQPDQQGEVAKIR